MRLSFLLAAIPYSVAFVAVFAPSLARADEGRCLEIVPPSLHFEMTLGQLPLPPALSVILTNTCVTTRFWFAQTDVSWLELSATSGELPPGGSTAIEARVIAPPERAGLNNGVIRWASATEPNHTLTQNVSLHVRLPAPQLLSEPAVFSSSTNLVSWMSAPGANEYQVQASHLPDFGVTMDSPWVRSTNWVFTGLTHGTLYYFRVHCRSNTTVWSQTLAHQFATNESTGISTRSRPGAIVLAGDTNRLWLEDFEEPGSSWTNTLFNDMRWAGGALFERGPQDESTLATDTAPELPINQRGDKEGRILYASGYHRYLFMAAEPENQLTDSTVDAYFSFVPGSYWCEGGIILRATAGVTNSQGGIGGNGYCAFISTYTNGTRSLDLLTLAGGILYHIYTADGDFSRAGAGDQYHLRFSAKDSTYTATLWQLLSRNDIIEEVPVVFSNGTNSLSFTGQANPSGVAAMSALAWSANGYTNTVFMDDVTVLAQDAPLQYTNSGVSIATVTPPEWFSRWGTLEYTAGAAAPGTTLSIDVLDTAGNVLATNLGSGTDLGSIPEIASMRSVRLRATLGTTNPEFSPELADWTVRWELPANNPSESAWSAAVASTNDQVAPVFQILTPTEDPLITVTGFGTFTGTASDDGSGIRRIRAILSDAQTTNNFTNWTLTVQAVNSGTNTISFIAFDWASPANVARLTRRLVSLQPSDPAARPVLRAVAASGNAVITWHPPHPFDILQGATQLAPADWTNLPASSLGSATVPLAGPFRFFRVRRP